MTERRTVYAVTPEDAARRKQMRQWLRDAELHCADARKHITDAPFVCQHAQAAIQCLALVLAELNGGDK